MSPSLIDKKALVRKHGGCISKMQNRQNLFLFVVLAL